MDISLEAPQKKGMLVACRKEFLSMAKKELVIGTKNKDKRREIQSLAGARSVKVLSLNDFPACPEAVENGKTFAANARKKAGQYSRRTRRITLADDSGLMADFLKGKPGVYSARFAGENCSYRDNNRKLLRLMKEVPSARRRAKFVCVMALYDNGRFIGLAKGICRGRIAPAEKGKNGFGYDPVFIPDGFSKTFAELPGRTKNRISHRARALCGAQALLRRYWKKVKARN